MSSSTSSSSEAANRRIFGRILLTIIAGMITALVILRFFTDLNDASAETILGRVVEARSALPAIMAEEQNLAIFFSSSMTHAGFSPRMFDRWMAEKGVGIKSFNFGFGGLNPYFQEILSRRIVEAFDAENRKIELLMIEFNPFQTTQIRWNRAKPIVDSFLTMLATDRELFEIAKNDLSRGIRLFTIRYFRNDISAEMITAFFGESLQTMPQESELPEDEAVSERREEILELLDGQLGKDYPDYDGSDWYLPWQGGGTIPLDRILTADIIQLRFEELLVESFIQFVRNFQQISNQVEIILLPANRDWIVNPPEASQRLAVVLERIERETGIKIRNLQDAPEITPDMYGDTTHLGRYTGDLPFAQLLVDELAPVLLGR